MAANATAVWRVRPSGNNNNGGGFDCSISAAATGTHGSFAGTTFTDATAAAFTTGMVGSAINITGVGQYKITARIDASNITLGSGNPALTLAAPLSWTVGSGQDYSQQNSPQLSQLGATSTATVTLTDAGASFTTAVIGNAIRVAGTGITTTYTFITARPSATTLTLQTSPGTTGTSVTYNIGGGWADFWTNTTSAGFVVAGNKIYILGSGTPNPAAYTYDYDATVNVTVPTGATIFANDPGTPGYKTPPDTTGGMPVIKFDIAGNAIFRLSGGTSELRLDGLWFVGTTTAASQAVVFGDNNRSVACIGCVLDQFSFDLGLLKTGFGPTNLEAVGTEVFSSVAGSVGTQAAFALSGGVNDQIILSGCNIHDCTGIGVKTTNADQVVIVVNSIFAKCQSDGMQIANTAGVLIQNCTIDGNQGHGIKITSGTQPYMTILNNIISNHTGVGKFGITSDTGGLISQFIDYNVYYNNTTDLNNLSYGPHDTHGGSNPYVASATENYSLV